MPGTLFVVATPIGNLEDITLRALRVLREVEVIAAEDTRRTAHLLARHAITTPTTSLHEHNEKRKSGAILERLQRGGNVALVSDAGTPTVSDPGGELIQNAIAAGFRVEAVPGPSAVLAALSASGIAADAFTFLGFPPTRAKDRIIWFQRLERAAGAAIFFEAPHRIQRTLTDLQRHIGDRDVVIARELTKAHEELVRGPISQVGSRLQSTKGEFTVVIFIGHLPDNIRSEIDESLDKRRKALAALAQSHGITANQLYRAIEEAKKLGE